MNFAGEALCETSLKNAGDATWGAELFGLPLGIELVSVVTCGETEIEIRHVVFLSVMSRMGNDCFPTEKDKTTLSTLKVKRDQITTTQVKYDHVPKVTVNPGSGASAV